MVSLKINKSQLLSLEKKMSKLKSLSQRGLSQELGTIGLDSARRAKKKAPIDTGNLRQSISSERIGDRIRVSAKADYAPYIEFGTGSNVTLDDMTELGIPASYASQFKGDRPGNIKPQPYFYSSVREAYYQGLGRINQRLKKLTR